MELLDTESFHDTSIFTWDSAKLLLVFFTKKIYKKTSSKYGQYNEKVEISSFISLFFNIFFNLSRYKNIITCDRLTFKTTKKYYNNEKIMKETKNGEKLADEPLGACLLAVSMFWFVCFEWRQKTVEWPEKEISCHLPFLFGSLSLSILSFVIRLPLNNPDRPSFCINIENSASFHHYLLILRNFLVSISYYRLLAQVTNVSQIKFILHF